jgi:Rrf2 family protein
MNRCIDLTQGDEYALASLARLALCHPKAVPVERLAVLHRIPRAFLAKILGRCAKFGIVRAKTGPAGGMTLAREPEAISILDVVEACGGGLRRAFCVFFSERPCPGADCPNYCALRRGEEKIRQELKDATLAGMARALNDHPLNRGEREWTQRRPA